MLPKFWGGDIEAAAGDHDTGPHRHQSGDPDRLGSAGTVVPSDGSNIEKALGYRVVFCVCRDGNRQ